MRKLSSTSSGSASDSPSAIVSAERKFLTGLEVRMSKLYFLSINSLSARNCSSNSLRFSSGSGGPKRHLFGERFFEILFNWLFTCCGYRTHNWFAVSILSRFKRKKSTAWNNGRELLQDDSSCSNRFVQPRSTDTDWSAPQHCQHLYGRTTWRRTMRAGWTRTWCYTTVLTS
jgi:hypothetical protein